MKLRATILYVMILSLLAGCRSQRAVEPVVVKETHFSERSDSVGQWMRSLMVLLQSRKEAETVSDVERVSERTVVNESGDTVRHDTRTERSTVRMLMLERENVLLQRQNDSLRNVTARVDSVAVPVPYKVEVPVSVERKLTWWERTRLKSWWWMAVALTCSCVYIFRKPIILLARRVLSSER